MQAASVSLLVLHHKRIVCRFAAQLIIKHIKAALSILHVLIILGLFGQDFLWKLKNVTMILHCCYCLHGSTPGY